MLCCTLVNVIIVDAIDSESTAEKVDTRFAMAAVAVTELTPRSSTPSHAFVGNTAAASVQTVEESESMPCLDIDMLLKVSVTYSKRFLLTWSPSQAPKG